jgi:AraC-like DNA-binding protein
MPDSLAVHRLSSLTDVEFWSTAGCERPRTRLSEMFSASLVLGPCDAECGRVWIRGTEQPFRSGDILLVEADEIQRITPSDRPSALFTIFWQRSALERAARESGLAGPLQWAVAQLSASSLSADFARLHMLLEAAGDSEAILQAYRATTESLLRAANCGAATVKRGVPHPGVRRAARRVRSSFAESLSLDDLAAELQMSKCHLARCFERALGVPPHRYRRLLRLQAARRLLEAGLSVGEAASETGFADAPHLTRAFRDWLGVSPAAWGSAWRASDPWSKEAPQTIAPPKPQ